MGKFFDGLANKFAKFVLTTTTPPQIIDLREGDPKLKGWGSLYSVAYLACEQTKARSLGSLPVAVYKREEKQRIPIQDHPLTQLFMGQANDLMTGRDLRHWLSIRRDTFGNAFVFVEWHQGEPVALWPINGSVQIDYNRHARAGRRLRYVISGDNYVPDGKYFADEVINIRTAVSKDGIWGKSLAKLAARDVGLSVDLEKFYDSMLKNGNHHLGHVEIPQGMVSQEVKDSLERAIEAKRGVDSAGKAPIFGYGAKWITDTQSMKDASVIEQQAWVLQQVCRATCVPPSKVYDMSRATYSNSEVSKIDYASDTIAPEATDIESAFKPVLISMGQKDLYLKFDLNGLMRGDVQARGQFYREMVYMGAMTRNEVRAKEEMNPIDGLDKPLVPVNYGIVEEDGSVTVLGNSEPADGMQTNTTDKES